MITENLSTLKIHKLTQEQYDRELEAGRIDPSAIYLTPDDNTTTGHATPDWNENDTNSESYIKNRPFYVEYLGDENTLVIEEQTVEIDASSNYAQLSGNMQAPFKLGHTYIVNFNGVEYECVAWGSLGHNCIGNGDIYGGAGMGGDEPFSCDSYSDGSVYLNVATNGGTYTISIFSKGGEYVHKIDEKYLPNTLSAIEDHNNNETAHSDIRELINELNSNVEKQIDEALANFSSGKTLNEHFVEEKMVLTSLQYGNVLPSPDIPGRIFFLMVNE